MNRITTYLLPLIVFSGFLLFSTWCGIGKTYDSQHYEAAAKSFYSCLKFIQKDGKPFSEWPPLYPIALSLFSNHIDTYAAVLNLICILISISLWINMAEEYLKDYILIYGLTLSLSTSLLMISSFLWSESLFLLFLSLYLKLLQVYFKTKHYKWLLLSSIAGFLMLLTRYAGLPIVAGVAVTFLFSGKSINVKTIKFLIAHFLIVIIGIVYWYYSTHKFIELSGIHTSIYTNITPLVNELSYWFLPDLKIALLRWIITILIILVILYAHIKTNSLFVKMLVYQAAIYCLMFTVLLYDFSEMSRLMAVLYPSIVLIIFIAVKNLTINYPNRKKIFLIIIILWISYPLIRISYNALRFHRNNCNAASVSFVKF